MDYRQTLEFIKECSSFGIVPGLDNMYNLMEELGNPQNNLKIIHIAGTNGKGSVGAFIEGILKADGKKVGRYTSPAVFDEFEKYTVNGEKISQEDFCSCMEDIKNAIDKITASGKNHATAFEAETAAAFLYFEKNNCDYVLIEAGMGGRLDATNIIKSPIASVITKVSKDHTAFLGETLEEIAFEKCGIIKEGCAIISALQSDCVKTVIENCAKKKSSKLIFAKKPVFNSFDGLKQYFDYDGIKDIELCALGKYQIENAALAIEVVKEICNISEAAIRNGLKDVIWQGRFEILCKSPLIIADGAHNEDGVSALMESIEEYFPQKRIIYITGTFADKAYDKTVRISAKRADKIYTITPSNERGLSGEIYAREFKKYNENTVFTTLEKAVKECMREKDTVIVGFGSLSFLASLKKEVGKNDMTRVNLIYNNPLYKEILGKIKECEKNRIYCRHALEHSLDVARISYIMALEDGIDIKKDIIYAAALMHDMGRAAQYADGIYHADESVRLCDLILPQCGYSKEEINEISCSILAHGGNGLEGLSGIIQRADKVSRICVDCESIKGCKWSSDELNMKILF